MSNGQQFEEWLKDNKGLADKTSAAAEYKEWLKDQEGREEDRENE
jgi:hypothetical protein